MGGTAGGLVLAGIGWLLIALAAAGVVYTLDAALALRRFLAGRGPAAPRAEGVTLLKPLHGAEPRLVDNLATFLRQQHEGPVQLLCGVARADDPAIAAVERLRAAFPDATIDLVVDGRRHGANGKIGNLINMAPRIAHDTVVLSDSDMAVPPDYLARVLGALAAPGVGLVTCVYAGRGDAGRWSALAAAAVNYGFLPSVLVGRALDQAQPCMGSTIALRRATLARIGGFAAFADQLADDYAIGAAVRATGERIAIPPMILTHCFDETTPGAVWRHERRWAATTRTLAPAGHAGSVVTHPLPLALLALPLAPRAGAVAVAAALAARWLLKRVADRAMGTAPIAWWGLPARDLASFGVFLASFGARSVDRRGARFRMAPKGRMAAETELP